MLIYGNRSIWPSKTLRGRLTLLRVLRASCAARRAGSALAKSSSQSLCFPLTTTAMAATLRSSSSATAFSLDTFSVSIPTTWGQQIRFIWPYYTKKNTSVVVQTIWKCGEAKASSQQMQIKYPLYIWFTAQHRKKQIKHYTHARPSLKYSKWGNICT